MDTQLPKGTTRQREHKHMGHRMREHDRTGRRSIVCSLGVDHAQADPTGSGAAAGKARSGGFSSRSEACREEGIVMETHLTSIT
jgi:hypothetical protein